MIWKVFLINRKKNTLLASCVLLLNLIAALLEGTSFVMLLTSFAFLTGEVTTTKIWFHYLPSSASNPFLACLLGAIVLQIFRSLTSYASHWMTTLLTLDIQKEAQNQIFRRIFRMSYAEISQWKKGDLMHHVTAPPSFIPMVFEEYNRLTISIFMIGAYLVIMAGISISLTCYNVIFFAVVASLQRFFFNKICKASQLQADHIAQLSKETSQSLEGLKAVHIFQRQEQTISKLDTILISISKATLSMKNWNALIPSLNESLGIFLVGFSLVVGTLILQKSGQSYASQLFIYLTLTYRLGTRLQQLMIAKGALSYYSGPLNRLSTILRKKMEPHGQSSSFPIPFQEVISFEQVSFVYPHKKNYALKNITLSIPKRKVIALVGMSGAGKSSIIDLLLRLYSPSQGKISIDGKSIDDYSLANWRSLFGVVPQDAFLFNETIEENIRFGNLEASHGDIVKAAQMAGADLFIQNLPEKYQTVIGDRGYRLSGGEKQRISLAQALVKNPEILVLDEATSHLDSHSEQIVQEALSRLRSKKTLLVVAHRLSTIQMADLIYVIEKGRIIESGQHRDLLNLGGRYQLFWNLQTQGVNNVLIGSQEEHVPKEIFH